MKKLLVAILCVITCLSFSGCSMLYDYKTNALNNFDIGCSKKLKDAYVSSYHWDGTKKTMNIVIPEEYEGMPITALGGYHGSGCPSAFGVSLVSYRNTLCSDVNQWAHSEIYEDIEVDKTIYLNFNIHISKNIKQINEHTLGSFDIGTHLDGEEEEVKIIIVPLYTLTCDEDNRTFCAKDGKLYYRENGNLVSDILYYDFNGHVDN